ncbi:MAG: DNA mismatch repair endonuclease MutL, partial [Clostridia bacterium]|nr:DNA mismatch repair endonuclease MutL [Clostridia bacterium]
MGQIQVLSFEVANLIAAGEVVDRPASAIKEMMENSIDAGAKHITVEIQNGGVTFMRVTDDGCGMSAEDLPMAIRRHATSKIKNAEDLDGILTLGFRGEALAAISSVSDMRIMSKRPEDEMGAMLEIKGGQMVGISERGCRDGTTIIVENLFGNVPARRKFLKRDATESMAVSANVERVALSHPEIAVRLIVDGVTKLETAGDGQLRSAIWAVFGKDFASRLIPLDSEHEGIRITGFIGRSDNVKANRNGQNFFINNRFIRSRTAQAALEQAFVSYLPPEKYPCCVMNIHLNPARVDVNVHPAKLEVKFSNEKPVFEAVYYATRQALEQNVTRPEFAAPEKKPIAPGGGRVSDMTTPIEVERPQSLGKRQVAMDMNPTPTAPVIDTTPKATVHPPQERITAEDYVNYYVNRGHADRGHSDRNRKQTSDKDSAPVPPVAPPPQPPVKVTPAPVTPPPAEEIPMDVYEAEAKALFGDVPPPEEPAVPSPATVEADVPDGPDGPISPAVETRVPDEPIPPLVETPPPHAPL